MRDGAETALALASAILWGLVMLLMSLANLIWGRYGQFLQIMSSVYPGYHATRSIAEVVVGTLYGAVDALILARVKQCELWISDKGWTVQQKFHTEGGDYMLSTYSNMKLNPNIADKDLRLELPKGVKFGKLK